MTDNLSTVSSRQQARTRQELIDAAVRLILGGHQPTMRAIATEAQVGERTIYRYFESADACTTAVMAQIEPRLGTPLCSQIDDLEDYARRLYATFDANQELTVAYLQSTWTAPTLEASRRANLEALRRLLADGIPDADPDELRHGASVLRTVLSGSGWLFQRHSCGLSADEAIDNARWLVRTTLSALGHRARPASRRR